MVGGVTGIDEREQNDLKGFDHSSDTGFVVHKEIDDSFNIWDLGNWLKSRWSSSRPFKTEMSGF